VVLPGRPTHGWARPTFSMRVDHYRGLLRHRLRCVAACSRLLRAPSPVVCAGSWKMPCRRTPHQLFAFVTCFRHGIHYACTHGASLASWHRGTTFWPRCFGRSVASIVQHVLPSCRRDIGASWADGCGHSGCGDSWTRGQGGRSGCPSVAFHMLPHLGMPPLQPEHHACVCSSLSSALASVLVPAPHTSGRGRAVRDAQHLNPPLGSPVTGVGH